MLSWKTKVDAINPPDSVDKFVPDPDSGVFGLIAKIDGSTLWQIFSADSM
jgi:hypothetical protein